MNELIRVHGTYPFDMKRNSKDEMVWPWRRVRDLSNEEAFQLLKDAGACDERHRRTRDSDLKGGPRMLNKGFVVLRLAKVEGPNTINHAMIEKMGGTIQPRDMRIGDEAVYQHDFEFSLIRWVGMKEDHEVSARATDPDIPSARQ